MSIGVPDVPAELPRLQIAAYGGTIMSHPDYDEKTQKTIILPRPDAADILCSTIPDAEYGKFASVKKSVHPELIDSATAIANIHIQQIVQDIRRKLEEDAADVFILLYGTDTMADLIAALGIGISREELGNKTIIATCSMQHIETEKSDAMRNFNRAVTLAQVQELRGRIGLCVNNRYFPPRGIEKVELSVERPFISRYRRMIKFDEDDSEWQRPREELLFDHPIGVADKPFLLTQGIEEISLTPTSDYKNIKKAVINNKATIILAPGNGNLRTDPDSKKAIQNAATAARGPLIVVGKSIQNGEQLMPQSEWETEMYAGDSSLLSKIISGGAMTATEARIYVSHLVAQAEVASMSPAETAEFIKFNVSAYPFHSANSNRWRKNENGNATR